MHRLVAPPLILRHHRGLLLALDAPTEEVRKLAVNAGQYESELWGAKFDRIQILTVAELLAGKKPDVPKFMPAYQKAARIAAEAGEQRALWEAAQPESRSRIRSATPSLSSPPVAKPCLQVSNVTRVKASHLATLFNLVPGKAVPAQPADRDQIK